MLYNAAPVQVNRQLREALDSVEANSRQEDPADLACVLDGKALQIMLRPEQKASLLKLGMQCKVRTTPLWDMQSVKARPDA